MSKCETTSYPTLAFSLLLNQIEKKRDKTNKQKEEKKSSEDREKRKHLLKLHKQILNTRNNTAKKTTTQYTGQNPVKPTALFSPSFSCQLTFLPKHQLRFAFWFLPLSNPPHTPPRPRPPPLPHPYLYMRSDWYALGLSSHRFFPSPILSLTSSSLWLSSLLFFALQSWFFLTIMAAAPPAGTTETDAASGEESYIGSLISLISKSDIRYEGFLSHLNTQESTLCLRNGLLFFL